PATRLCIVFRSIATRRKAGALSGKSCFRPTICRLPLIQMIAAAGGATGTVGVAFGAVKPIGPSVVVAGVAPSFAVVADCAGGVAAPGAVPGDELADDPPGGGAPPSIVPLITGANGSWTFRCARTRFCARA